MKLYGINKVDLENQQLRRDKQVAYLSSKSFQTQNGEFKSYLDVNMSANISSRYYAQLCNKVNTLEQIMSSYDDLVPTMLTGTLDGAYHKLLNGDYSKFTLYHQKRLPENDTNGYLQTKASERLSFSVNDLYQLLRFQWTGLQKSHYFTKMRAVGHKIGYLFAVEPHDSGVPHFHCLLYIHKDYLHKVKEAFKRYVWAPQNIKSTRKKKPSSKKGLTKEQIDNGEINGFQWTLSNPVGYIMKYCTKSFMDIKNRKELDELQAWYMKHKIIRLTMSHTLVPQWVYNKIFPLESCWHYLSDLKINSTCEWSQKDNTFEFTDYNKNQVLRYDNGLYQRFINGELREEFGTKRQTIKHSATIDGIEFIPLYFNHSLVTDKDSYKLFRIANYKKKYPNGKPIQKKKTKIIPIKIVENGIERDLYKKSITNSSSYDLIKEYALYNSNDGNLQRYINLQNELINRGIENGKINSLNIVDILEDDLQSYIDNYEFDLSVKKALFSYSSKNTKFKQANKVIVDLYTKEFYKSFHRFDMYKLGA